MRNLDRVKPAHRLAFRFGGMMSLTSIQADMFYAVSGIKVKKDTNEILSASFRAFWWLKEDKAIPQAGHVPDLANSSDKRLSQFCFYSGGGSHKFSCYFKKSYLTAPKNMSLNKLESGNQWILFLFGLPYTRFLLPNVAPLESMIKRTAHNHQMHFELSFETKNITRPSVKRVTLLQTEITTSTNLTDLNYRLPKPIKLNHSTFDAYPNSELVPNANLVKVYRTPQRKLRDLCVINIPYLVNPLSHQLSSFNICTLLFGRSDFGAILRLKDTQIQRWTSRMYLKVLFNNRFIPQQKMYNFIAFTRHRRKLSKHGTLNTNVLWLTNSSVFIDPFQIAGDAGESSRETLFTAQNGSKGSQTNLNSRGCQHQWAAGITLAGGNTTGSLDTKIGGGNGGTISSSTESIANNFQASPLQIVGNTGSRVRNTTPTRSNNLITGKGRIRAGKSRQFDGLNQSSISGFGDLDQRNIILQSFVIPTRIKNEYIIGFNSVFNFSLGTVSSTQEDGDRFNTISAVSSSQYPFVAD
ncbi:hypothetical protein CVS40_12564 [Lucilia cuprina]|nr:hypothetical protein CVS40_12564 [Lucilia cuprina]